MKASVVCTSVAIAGLLASANAFASRVDVYYDAGPGLGLAIPDNDPLGVSSTISIGDSFTIGRLAVVVALDHTWVGDLIFTLTGPDGTTITLADRPGSDTSSFGDSSNLSADHPIIFGDLSPIPAENMGGGSCTSTDSVIGADCHRWFAPNTSLDGTFDGFNAMGDWTLTVSDNAGADTGVIDGWLIAFDRAAAVPVPPAMWLFASGLFALVARRRRQ
jgi:subtilisin-like proprotein convertase family protein